MTTARRVRALVAVDRRARPAGLLDNGPVRTGSLRAGSLRAGPTRARERAATVRGAAAALDQRLFVRVARARLPVVGRVLPGLSRAADHGVLWSAAAAGLAACGTPQAKRAAGRALGSLLVASALANVVAKRMAGRPRPELSSVPLVRHLRRAPFTSSFPSGHSASAAAFAVGLGLESPALGVAAAPVALGVMLSRVYVGAHYPGDVLAGAALGASAAVLLRRRRPGPQTPPPPAGLPGPAVQLPALPGGAGLHVVVNSGSGAGGLADLWRDADADDPNQALIRDLLPKADVQLASDGDALPQLIAEAAERARADGGALGICGGDGSINLAAGIAAEHDLPLAVFTGGTLNHFAADAGITDFATVAAAVTAGSGIAVDLGTVTDPGGDRHRVFVNTFSIGVYPDLVRLRERWEHRIGKWPALALAGARLLHTAEPVELEIAGRPRRIWLLFAGNGRYHRRGVAPITRERLDDGVLDARVVNAGHRFTRLRLAVACLTGALDRTRFYHATRLRALELTDLTAVSHLSVDGEAVPAPDALRLASAAGALRIYRVTS
ncbi:phosphatase PAP2 family protein [Kitasatospora sp. NBC_01250]|uniref:bifunctional phosphatase PAP2/diacylglycerol kinase family protein n=1 Tax=Kitasatospora sp. NBC_01250 TaxID=2903571 RepID=UPI002E3298A9|nr:phosphatase PAP2 family protein [Kitasatospora sp. NBC_01250]